MANRSIRKRLPMRGKAFKQIRELPNGGLETITLQNGTEMIVNPMKHFLLQKEYVHEELKTHLMRKIGRQAIGEKRWAELQQQAVDMQNGKSLDTVGVVPTNIEGEVNA